MENIRSDQWLTTGEQQNGNTHLRQIFYKLFSLSRCHFIPVFPVIRAYVTVFTVQIAPVSNIPDYQWTIYARKLQHTGWYFAISLPHFYGIRNGGSPTQKFCTSYHYTFHLWLI
jgi:hypothetical protein